MSLRKRFLFAMLFTIVALAADGRGSVSRAEFLPIQFKNLQLKNPQDLGVGKVLVAARIDQEVFDWLRQYGKGYSTRINGILRTVMEQAR